VDLGEAMRRLGSRSGVRFEEVDHIDGVAIAGSIWLSGDLPAEDALDTWEAARVEMGSTRLVPVLLGAEPMIHGRQVRGPLPPVDALAVRDALENALVARFSRPVVDRLRAEMAAIRPAWLARSGGSPPGERDLVPFDPGEAVRCALIRGEPWEVPLRLGVGGEGLPEPREHAAILHGWWRDHGAMIAHVGRGELAIHVERPPVRVEDFPPLLWDTLLYCCDAVFQDEDASFAGLRRMLAGPWWSFGWD
jgi:hypothetical protein